MQILFKPALSTPQPNAVAARRHVGARPVLHVLAAAALAAGLSACGTTTPSQPKAAAPAAPAVAVAAAASQAAPSTANPVLVRGPGGEVTLQDVQDTVDRLLAPERRAEFFSQRKAIDDLAQSIYTERVLAQQARKDGFDRQAKPARQLQQAATRALSDLWVGRAGEAATITDAEAERLAQTQYRAAAPGTYQRGEERVVRHIFIATARKPEAQARAEAQDLLRQLRRGADFAKLAAAHSDDRSSSANGGLLPQFAKGGAEYTFEQAAFALTKAKPLSDVVKAPEGLHIIHLDQIVAPRVVPFEEVRTQLMDEIKARQSLNARAAVWKAAQDGMTVDADAIGAAVRPVPAKP